MRALLVSATTLTLLACAPAAPDPAVVEVTAGLEIRREVVRLTAPPAPANPLTGGATPEGLDAVQVVRFRVNTPGAPRPARAIFVLLPGFLGGAGSFDGLARAIVRRSTADASFEAWAVDRRANLLEDHAGLDAAAAAEDADVATGYYFEGRAVDGRTFQGFHTQESLDFASEWGVASTLADLRAVLERIPEADRKARVVLVGHSLGASLAAQFAAWDFDGAAGHEALAGLVLIDGVTGSEGEPLPFTREQYETSGTPAFGASGPSLAQVRERSRYVALPILEAKLFAVASGTALRARLAPNGFARDVQRAEALKALFLLDRLPPMTNRAAFGLAFDAETSPVSIGAVNAGASEGGALADAPALFGGGTLKKPSDPNATYRWREYDQVAPREVTFLGDLALAFTRPQVDFGEWYFPARLSLDAPLGASLALAADAWPVTAYGVRALHGRSMGVPVLVEAAGLLGGDTAKYDRLKALLPPVGAGRPLEGAARSTQNGFQAVAHPGFSHIDPLQAADDPGSEAEAWYSALVDFGRRNTPGGGVAVDLR